MTDVRIPPTLPAQQQTVPANNELESQHTTNTTPAQLTTQQADNNESNATPADRSWHDGERRWPTHPDAQEWLNYEHNNNNHNIETYRWSPERWDNERINTATPTSTDNTSSETLHSLFHGIRVLSATAYDTSERDLTSVCSADQTPESPPPALFHADHTSTTTADHTSTTTSVSSTKTNNTVPQPQYRDNTPLFNPHLAVLKPLSSYSSGAAFDEDLLRTLGEYSYTEDELEHDLQYLFNCDVTFTSATDQIFTSATDQAQQQPPLQVSDQSITPIHITKSKHTTAPRMLYSIIYILCFVIPVISGACTVTPTHITYHAVKGWVSCSNRVNLQLHCHTDNTLPTKAQITCGPVTTAVLCTTDTHVSTQNWFFPTAHIKLTCKVTCHAQTTYFGLEYDMHSDYVHLASNTTFKQTLKNFKSWKQALSIFTNKSHFNSPSRHLSRVKPDNIILQQILNLTQHINYKLDLLTTNTTKGSINQHLANSPINSPQLANSPINSPFHNPLVTKTNSSTVTQANTQLPITQANMAHKITTPLIPAYISTPMPEPRYTAKPLMHITTPFITPQVPKPLPFSTQPNFPLTDTISKLPSETTITPVLKPTTAIQPVNNFLPFYAINTTFKTVYLTGNGFLQYDSRQHGINHLFELVLWIKPFKSNALLMYTGHLNDNSTEYIALIIEKDYPIFLIQTKYELFITAYPQPLILEKWVQLRIHFEYGSGGLQVDSGHSQSVLHPNISWNAAILNSTMFIGGCPNGTLLPARIDHLNGLDGALQRITINNNYNH